MSLGRVFRLGPNCGISPKRCRSRSGPTRTRRRYTLTRHQKVALVQFLMQNLSSLQSIRDVRADISCADMLLKFGLAHQTGGLLTRAAQNKTSSGIVHSVGQIFEGLQARGVDRRHISETKHHNGRQIRKTGDDLVNFVRSSKKKRPVNAEDAYIRRDFLVLQNMDVPLPQILLSDL